jgi:hypothetical protein
MISVTYFICGVRVKGTTRLEIKLRGGATAPTPALRHLAQSGHEQTVTGDNGRWTVALEAGDHIICIEHEEYGPDEWPGVTLELPPGGILVTSRTKNKPEAWQAEVGGSDPKDPWPPPGAVQSLDDARWFQQTFGSLQIVLPRGDD